MGRFNFKTIVIIFMIIHLSHFAEIAAYELAPNMVTTQSFVEHLSRQEAEQKIIAQLEKEEIQNELVKYGVDPSEAKQRLASLSDQELSDLALQMDQAQYGGVTGILVIVVLVLLIVYLAKRI